MTVGESEYERTKDGWHTSPDSFCLYAHQDPFHVPLELEYTRTCAPSLERHVLLLLGCISQLTDFMWVMAT